MPIPTRLQERLKSMSGHFLGMQDTIAQQLRLLQQAVQYAHNPYDEDIRDVLDRVEVLDADIDRAQRCIEQEALELLALQAPVARDLRQVLLMIQSSPDLERAGDYAKHMARIVHSVIDTEPEQPLLCSEHIPVALSTLTRMVSLLRASAHPMDSEMAKRVIEMDDQIDELYAEVQNTLLGDREVYTDAPIEAAVKTSQFWRAAERLGDHLQNVASRIVHIDRT